MRPPATLRGVLATLAVLVVLLHVAPLSTGVDAAQISLRGSWSGSDLEIPVVNFPDDDLMDSSTAPENMLRGGRLPLSKRRRTKPAKKPSKAVKAKAKAKASSLRERRGASKKPVTKAKSVGKSTKQRLRNRVSQKLRTLMTLRQRLVKQITEERKRLRRGRMQLLMVRRRTKQSKSATTLSTTTTTSTGKTASSGAAAKPVAVVTAQSRVTRLERLLEVHTGQLSKLNTVVARLRAGNYSGLLGADDDDEDDDAVDIIKAPANVTLRAFLKLADAKARELRAEFWRDLAAIDRTLIRHNRAVRRLNRRRLRVLRRGTDRLDRIFAAVDERNDRAETQFRKVLNRLDLRVRQLQYQTADASLDEEGRLNLEAAIQTARAQRAGAGARQSERRARVTEIRSRVRSYQLALRSKRAPLSVPNPAQARDYTNAVARAERAELRAAALDARVKELAAEVGQVKKAANECTTARKQEAIARAAVERDRASRAQASGKGKAGKGKKAKKSKGKKAPRRGKAKAKAQRGGRGGRGGGRRRR
ncbi:hypothetical protein H9P43_004291 [Blastocladiella emersonii ATCC 22665]|nr:hypothetical protein H9P43_004291 [Blastocladiella emersonii ATCC 22665]